MRIIYLCGLMLALAFGQAGHAEPLKRVHVQQMQHEELRVAVQKAAIDLSHLTRIWCVPFARKVSGIEIRGNAWTWWEGAGQAYPKGKVPVPGSVLTFRKTGKMPMGHVAVVSQIVDSRRIVVDQANWVRNRITSDMVIDVSKNNDWSAVRVQNRQNSFGSVYPTYGFIYKVADAR